MSVDPHPTSHLRTSDGSLPINPTLPTKSAFGIVGDRRAVGTSNLILESSTKP